MMGKGRCSCVSVFMRSVRSSPDTFTSANRATAVSGRRALCESVLKGGNMTGAIKKEKKKELVFRNRLLSCV